MKKSPTYETDADREVQESGAQLVEKAWDVVIDHQGSKPWDWRIHNQAGMLVGLGEFKARNWTMVGSGEVWLSMEKALKICMEAKRCGVCWYFFVWMNNGLWSTRIHQPLLPHYERRLGKREAGNRVGDRREQLLLIPYSEFKLVSDAKRVGLTR